MARRGNSTNIKSDRIYTVWEAAKETGNHRQTITRWIKSCGLIAENKAEEGTEASECLWVCRRSGTCPHHIRHRRKIETDDAVFITGNSVLNKSRNNCRSK